MQVTKQDDNKREDKLISLNGLREKIAVINHKNKWLLSTFGFSTGLVLLLTLIFLIHRQSNSVSTLTSKEDKQAVVMLNELNDVDSQLNQLSIHSQNGKIFKIALKTINTDLSAIQKSMTENSKRTDVEKISTQIALMKSDVDAQIIDLKRVVAGGIADKQYLDPKILPFRVISIDVISQEPFVSVDYVHHITPLAVGDAVAGWTITCADYDKGTVEFKNSTGKYIQETLAG